MSEVRESVSAPFKCLFFFCWGVRGSCFMSCLVLKSVGLQRASHLCEEKLWTHQTDRELCEDRHEADCTHSTRHGPLGEAERTKEVKLLRLAEAILLITIWSLFFLPPVSEPYVPSRFSVFIPFATLNWLQMWEASPSDRKEAAVASFPLSQPWRSAFWSGRQSSANSHISLMYVNIYNIRFSDDQMHVG